VAGIKTGATEIHTTKGLIYEGWSHVSQEYINEKVSTMSERLKAVVRK